MKGKLLDSVRRIILYPHRWFSQIPIFTRWNSNGRDPGMCPP
jgi:hypothetical protein